MPFWKFTGTKPVRVGGASVVAGQTVQFSGSPGANFEEVADAAGNPMRSTHVAPKATSSQQPSGSSAKSKKKE